MSLEYFNLKDKVAIVAGGATGIGLAISEGLAEAGAKVVICSRRTEVCEEAAKGVADKTGGEAAGMRCDITLTAETDALAKQVIDKYGQIDILFNSAGIGGSEKPIMKMEENDWDSVLNINLKGAYVLSKSVVPYMIERGKGGKIINVASIGGMVGIANMSAYTASKGGMIQLSKSMALEWTRHNINVNSLLPGYFETPMNTKFFSSDAGKAMISRMVPMKRLGQPEEIKGTAIFLSSDASNFITGASLTIDGGYTTW